MNNTEKDAVRKEMTIDEIRALPNILGVVASQKCTALGEYKCTIGGERTHIVLVG